MRVYVWNPCGAPFWDTLTVLSSYKVTLRLNWFCFVHTHVQAYQLSKVQSFIFNFILTNTCFLVHYQCRFQVSISSLVQHIHVQVNYQFKVDLSPTYSCSSSLSNAVSNFQFQSQFQIMFKLINYQKIQSFNFHFKPANVPSNAINQFINIQSSYFNSTCSCVFKYKFNSYKFKVSISISNLQMFHQMQSTNA